MQVESIAECQAKHSAILLTNIKRSSVLETYFWSSFEWPIKTGFTVVLKSRFSNEEIYNILLRQFQIYS